jgi:hypothetical protein
MFRNLGLHVELLLYPWCVISIEAPFSSLFPTRLFNSTFLPSPFPLRAPILSGSAGRRMPMPMSAAESRRSTFISVGTLFPVGPRQTRVRVMRFMYDHSDISSILLTLLLTSSSSSRNSHHITLTFTRSLFHDPWELDEATRHIYIHLLAHILHPPS